MGNRFLFTGREWDASLGLYDYRTRYYDPRQGRFVARDTIGAWGDTLNLGNPYAYVGNNPWSFVDPYGLSSADVDPTLVRKIQKISQTVLKLTPTDEFGQEITDPRLRGTWWHTEFQSRLNALNDPRLATELNITAGGYSSGRWAKSGYRRPDVMILKEGESLQDILSAGKPFKGRVDAVVDLKTGERGIGTTWAGDVTNWLGIHSDDIHQAGVGMNLVGAFRIAGGKRAGLAKAIAKKGGGKIAGKAFIIAGVALAYQDARAQGWDETNAQAYALASVFGADIVIDTMLFASREFWNFAGSVGENKVTAEHIARLNELLADEPVQGGYYDPRTLDVILEHGSPRAADSQFFGR